MSTLGSPEETEGEGTGPAYEGRSGSVSGEVAADQTVSEFDGQDGINGTGGSNASSVGEESTSWRSARMKTTLVYLQSLVIGRGSQGYGLCTVRALRLQGCKADAKASEDGSWISV